jgi:hypothetical protein
MASVADIERFLERLFERSTASLFRTRIQVVQLEHRVERSMERSRSSNGARTLVPGRYRVRLHPTDLDGLAPGPDEAVALAGHLADAALAFARAHAYHLPSRPVIVIVADPSLARGQIEVDAAPMAGHANGLDAEVAVAPAWTPSAPLFIAAVPVGPGPTLPPGVPIVPAPATRPTPSPAPTAPAIELEPAMVYPEGIRGDGTQTMVYRRPAPPAARAVLRVTAPDGSEQTIEVDGRPLAIGRAADNEVVLADARVSRHHGRLQTRRGALVYTDLGSTNGTRVNGIRVDEIALGMGDRVQLGDTVLVVETLPG